MQQDRDEPVWSFCARLRGQPNVCKYTLTCLGCNKDINYTNQIVMDCVVRGITDDDIRLDVLGNNNEDLDLDETVALIESKESGKRSIARLTSSQNTEVVKSTYLKQKGSSATEQATLCSHCGQNGHGYGSSRRTRKEMCPAYGQTCGKCNSKHHFSSVCKSKQKLDWAPRTECVTSRSHIDSNNQGAMQDALCSKDSDFTLGSSSADHLYGNMCQRWFRKPSKDQPYIAMEMTV